MKVRGKYLRMHVREEYVSMKMEGICEGGTRWNIIMEYKGHVGELGMSV